MQNHTLVKIENFSINRTGMQLESGPLLCAAFNFKIFILLNILTINNYSDCLLYQKCSFYFLVIWHEIKKQKCFVSLRDGYYLYEF